MTTTGDPIADGQRPARRPDKLDILMLVFALATTAAGGSFLGATVAIGKTKLKVDVSPISFSCNSELTHADAVALAHGLRPCTSSRVGSHDEHGHICTAMLGICDPFTDANCTSWEWR